MQKTKAVIFDGIDQIRVGEVTLKECEPNQIIAKTIYSFTSPGTELRVLGGHYGAKDNFPLVPGYSSVSKVIYCGENVKDFRVGDFISCRNPGKSFVECRSHWGGQVGMNIYNTSEEITPVLLPDVSEEELLKYTITEVASISLRGVAPARPEKGEAALVIGAGMIGQFAAMHLVNAGCRVVVCDIDDNRLKDAGKLGISATVDLKSPGAEDRLLRHSNGGYNIVIEASGSTPGTGLAFRMLRNKKAYTPDYKNWPRLVMLANYIEDVPINPHDFIKGEGVLILTPFDRSIEERVRIIEDIRRGVIDPSPFLNVVCKPEQMPEHYRKLQRKEISSLICDWR